MDKNRYKSRRFWVWRVKTRVGSPEGRTMENSNYLKFIQYQYNIIRLIIFSYRFVKFLSRGDILNKKLSNYRTRLSYDMKICRSRSEGIIRLKPSASADNTLLDLHNSSYDTQPRPVIANHTTLSSRLKPNRWISGLFMVIKVARNSFKHLHFDVSL